MAFTDLAAFIAPGLELPIDGKTYLVPEPGIKEGLYLQAIVDTGESLAISAAITSAENRRTRRAQGDRGPSVVTDANRAILNDAEERTVYQLALGSAYDDMVADGVTWPRLKHAGMTAVVRWTRSLEAAERFWAGYGQGKAEAATTSPTRGDTSPEDTSTPAPA